MIVVEVQTGSAAGQRRELDADVVRLGRAEDSDVVVPDSIVSGDHARLQKVEGGLVLRDLGSTNGTTVLRGEERIALDDAPGREILLAPGDVVELGTGEGAVRVRVTLAGPGDAPAGSEAGDGEDAGDGPRVVAVRRIDEISPASSGVAKDASVLTTLYAAAHSIGAASDLDEVLVATADAAFRLVPRATHATLALRDDDDADGGKRDAALGYVPVVTRVRGGGAPAGPIPITRSVVRRVVRERAAVIAADAPVEMGTTESLLGASIRSTMGVPLWKGEEILGVLQLDNREASGVFTAFDLEAIAVLAHNASLAVANARLLRRLRAAEERLRKENAFLKGREESRRTGGRGGKELLGESDVMKALDAQIDKVASTRVTVLIEGETGTGKELVASAVHYRSRRREKLFVGQNCAAMQPELLESELFGHKKGSFTGAYEDKKGLFEIADGGTLFLDEVTEMPPQLQSKLLRVLQEGEVRPLGATAERRVDVRIVAATNRDIDREVKEGRFREDLYYRLKVFPLRVPPLRERRSDVPLLATHFLKRYGSELGKPSGGFSQQAMELLVAYDFPGNVRELENEVQRLVIQVEDGAFVTPEMLSPRIRQLGGVLEKAKPTKGTLKEMMDHVERWLLIEALREHDNNKTAAARTLGITREGLHKKLRALGVG